MLSPHTKPQNQEFHTKIFNTLQFIWHTNAVCFFPNHFLLAVASQYQHHTSQATVSGEPESCSLPV